MSTKYPVAVFGADTLEYDDVADQSWQSRDHPECENEDSARRHVASRQSETVVAARAKERLGGCPRRSVFESDEQH